MGERRTPQTPASGPIDAGAAPAPQSDLNWMELQAHTLFEEDARGRLRALREAERRPAPRFFLGRTAHGNLWRLRFDLPRAAVVELARLAGREAALPRQLELPPPPERSEPFRRVLADSGVVVESEWRGPAFRFPEEVAAPVDARPELRPVSPETFDSLGGELDWLREEHETCAPAFVWIEQGRALGASFASRRAEGIAAEAGVETVVAARGRGIASALVRRWAAEVARLGERPLYSCSWDNRASLGVARRLGLVRYGEDYHLT